MNLSKNEVVKYLIIILICAGIPLLFNFIFGFLPSFFPEFDVQRFSIKKLETPIYWTFLIASNVLTAFYIHVSEKRLGVKSNNIWQMFGLVFGFTGFLVYLLWNILNKTGQFLENNKEAHPCA